jgi:hypothetical protein
LNLREGTRRLALLLGVVGAILGGFASYTELQTVLNQRARHNRFAQLAASSVAEQARKNCFESSAPSEHQPWEKYQPPLPKGFIPDNPPYCFSPINDPNTFDYTPSELNSGGIKTVHFENREIASIEPQDGQTLYPTPAPATWLYLLIALFPVLGFLIPWGVVRSIGWVGAGFVQPAK